MKTITQHIRRRLEAGLHDRPTLAELRKTQWSKAFEKLMRNRMIMGSFRYGLMRNGGEKGYDKIGSLKARIALYEKTGNVECLADAANLCLLEFEHPGHPNANFNATDDGEHCF